MGRTTRDGHAIDHTQGDTWMTRRARRRRGSTFPSGIPIITIAREYGARGAAVGRLVADRLGFRIWDRELLAEQRDVTSLAEIAREIEAQGSTVLIGRGLGFLVSPSRALRVRVVCPLDLRVAGLIEREGVCEETARATIAYADGVRREFVRDVYGRDVEDVTAYDLWISTGQMSLDDVAAVIIATYRYRFGAETMSTIGRARPLDPTS